MNVKKELENLTIMTHHEPDWKRILRDVLKDAELIESDGDPAGHFWEFTLTDERMKELEAMNLWSMERWKD